MIGVVAAEVETEEEEEEETVMEIRFGEERGTIGLGFVRRLAERGKEVFWGKTLAERERRDIISASIFSVA